MGETAASNDRRPGHRRREAPPMVAIAIAAAAGWLALFWGCAAVTSDRRLSSRMRRFRLAGGPPDLGDPALVNLVTTRLPARRRRLCRHHPAPRLAQGPGAERAGA